MASLRQIRQRLRSIQSTKQIMRAMQLVSGSKLKRAQAKLMPSRALMEFLDELLQRVLRARMGPEHGPGRVKGRRRRSAEGMIEHPLCAPREGRPSLLVLFTSDAGLCGSYNTNLVQLAESHLRRDSARKTEVIYIGKKGHRYFTKRGYPATESGTPPPQGAGSTKEVPMRVAHRPAEAHLDLAGRPNLPKAGEIARSLMARFLEGRVGSVQLLYSRFVSATVYRPTILPWLPIPLSQSDAEGRRQKAEGRERLEYIFEPSPRRVFEELLPRWALAKFQLVMLEAFTSEHSARMIAMKSATDNAEEILKSLTLQRNKIRQAAITKELSEIVGTAEALK